MQAAEKGCHGLAAVWPGRCVGGGSSSGRQIYGVGVAAARRWWRVETIWRVTITSDIMPFIGGPTQTSSISTTLKFLEYLKTNYLLATALI